jgi:hypothetical protein
MLRDFKPKINVVEKRWLGVLPFTFKHEMDKHLVQDAE